MNTDDMDTNDKLSPRLDDQAAHDTEGMQRAGRSTRADESRDPEPPGEDQDEVDLAPGGDLTGGTPPGMSPVDVTDRAELGRYLGKEVWPAHRSTLLEQAQQLNAPDAVLSRLQALPGDREFTNLADAWQALGENVESRRT